MVSKKRLLTRFHYLMNSMNLYLTSTFANVAISFVDIFKLNPSENKVAFIANASDIYSEHPWTDLDHSKLVELGFVVEDIDLRIVQGNELRQRLSNIDIIFVAGGNVTYLLNIARTSGFIEIVSELVQHGKIYVDSSAGSALTGPSIEPFYNDEQLKLKETGHDIVLTDFTALGFVDFVILPHYDVLKFKQKFDLLREQFKDQFTFLTKEDDEAVAVRELEIINVAN